MSSIDEVEDVLDVLGAEERSLSRQRTRLHERIDFLHSGGYAHVDTATEMSRLRAAERELSQRRRRVHAQIDAALRERRRRRSAA